MITLKKLREDRGLSQYELAEITKMGRPNLSRLETGKSFPQANTIMRLAAFYGITREEFVIAVKNTAKEHAASEKATK